jgi:hypothetical protein
MTFRVGGGETEWVEGGSDSKPAPLKNQRVRHPAEKERGCELNAETQRARRRTVQGKKEQRRKKQIARFASFADQGELFAAQDKRDGKFMR